MTKPNKRRVHRNERRRLTEEEITLIESLIKGQASTRPLTWDDVVSLGEKNVGHRWTRQTLHAHDKIRNAYEKHLHQFAEYRATGKPPRNKAPEVHVLQQKLKKEQADKAVLSETIRQYDERFFTYLHNANHYGISEEQLSAPLVAPYRAQSDSKAKRETKQNVRKTSRDRERTAKR
jgi:hypothetical protein